MMPGLSWSRLSLTGIVLFISVVIGWLVIHFGPQYGIDTRFKQACIFIAV
jgi:type VI secretion system protein ImpL